MKCPTVSAGVSALPVLPFSVENLRSSLSNILTQKVALGSTVSLGKEKTWNRSHILQLLRLAELSNILSARFFGGKVNKVATPFYSEISTNVAMLRGPQKSSETLFTIIATINTYICHQKKLALHQANLRLLYFCTKARRFSSLFSESTLNCGWSLKLIIRVSSWIPSRFHSYQRL